MDIPIISFIWRCKDNKLGFDLFCAHWDRRLSIDVDQKTKNLIFDSHVHIYQTFTPSGQACPCKTRNKNTLEKQRKTLVKSQLGSHQVSWKVWKLLQKTKRKYIFVVWWKRIRETMNFLKTQNLCAVKIGPQKSIFVFHLSNTYSTALTLLEST